MSSLIVKTRKIDSITSHPNADTLDVAVIGGGWEAVIKRGNLSVGDIVVYIPPDTLMPRTIADYFNFTPYLAELPKSDPLRETHLRVKAARLRGVASFGCLLSIPKLAELGINVPYKEDIDCAELLNLKKWEPPVVNEGVGGGVDGDRERDNAQLHAYTDIENWRNYPHIFTEGEIVALSEKIHGQNCCVGLIQEADESGNLEWTWAARSHGVRRKEWFYKTRSFRREEFPDFKVGSNYSVEDKTWEITNELEHHFVGRLLKETENGFEPIKERSRFWKPLYIPGMKEMIMHAAGGDAGSLPSRSVCVFGEIYGPGIQNLDYEVEKGTIGFRIFDVSVGGNYVDFDTLVSLTSLFKLELAPVLYRGPYSRDVVLKHTDGKTTIGSGKHIREGIVIRPVKERNDPKIGRVILKSISADYLAAKNLTNKR